MDVERVVVLGDINWVKLSLPVSELGRACKVEGGQMVEGENFSPQQPPRTQRKATVNGRVLAGKLLGLQPWRVYPLFLIVNQSEPHSHGADTHSSIQQAYVTGQPDVQHVDIITGLNSGSMRSLWEVLLWMQLEFHYQRKHLLLLSNLMSFSLVLLAD
nr:hypothetical protein [Tanacetum cinerariifolium]